MSCLNDLDRINFVFGRKTTAPWLLPWLHLSKLGGRVTESADVTIDRRSCPLHVAWVHRYVSDSVPVVLILRLLDKLARANVVDVG